MNKNDLKRRLRKLGITVEGNYIRKKDVAIYIAMSSVFDGHPDVVFPDGLKKLGFKDSSWQNDETAFATKKINDDWFIGVWVYEKPLTDGVEHPFTVVKMPTFESDYDPNEAVEIAGVDTVEEIAKILNTPSYWTGEEWDNHTEYHTYKIYKFPKDMAEKYEATVPFNLAMRHSTLIPNIEIKINENEDRAQEIYNDLKANNLIDKNAKLEDIETDGSSKEIGVWYKGRYLYTLVEIV